MRVSDRLSMRAPECSTSAECVDCGVRTGLPAWAIYRKAITAINTSIWGTTPFFTSPCRAGGSFGVSPGGTAVVLIDTPLVAAIGDALSLSDEHTATSTIRRWPASLSERSSTHHVRHWSPACRPMVCPHRSRCRVATAFDLNWLGVSTFCGQCGASAAFARAPAGGGGTKRGNSSGPSASRPLRAQRQPRRRAVQSE